MITEYLKCLPNKFFQHLPFLYNFNKNETPVVFNNLIKQPVHKYPIKFSKNNFSLNINLSMVQNFVFIFVDPKCGMIF